MHLLDATLQRDARLSDRSSVVLLDRQDYITRTVGSH
jgi:hypothetical protein